MISGRTTVSGRLPARHAECAQQCVRRGRYDTITIRLENPMKPIQWFCTVALVCAAGIALAQTTHEAALKNLKFREIGPAIMGGRVDDFAVVESDPRIIYVGSASGGIFKTVNGGVTWEPIFDDQANPSIGDIALAPSDPSILWVGT